jgi:hypothetical protein
VKNKQNPKSPVLHAPLLIFLVLGMVAYTFASEAGAQSPEPSTSSIPGGSPASIWVELLHKTPYPHTAPLPPLVRTTLDGNYTKFDPKETPPVPCRRCPDYAPGGGIWKLNLDKGIFRIFHEATAWRSIGSFLVHGNQLRFFNDPYCLEAIGTYNWTLEEGRLKLLVVEDECAIGLRAMNFTKLPWLFCRPRSMEAAISDYGYKPPGCD